MMMRLPVYQSQLVQTSLQHADTRVELSSLLNQLDNLNELPLQLLDNLSAWKELLGEQRSSMLAFYTRSSRAGACCACVSSRRACD
jgi:hypothetical protein